MSLANTAESISIGRIFGALIALIGAGISIMFIRVENEKDWKTGGKSSCRLQTLRKVFLSGGYSERLLLSSVQESVSCLSE